MEKHISVLLNEVIDNLNIKEDGIYIDATIGFGGHSSEILKRIPKGKLIGFDKDINAVTYSTERLKSINDNFIIYNEGFENIKKRCEEENIKPDGILFDLGLSSVEIDDASRGFSYMQDAKLDMRMDLNSPKTAEEIVNTYTVEELTKVFREYGEEKHALKIAKEIEKERLVKRIETTKELVDIIDRCYPYKEKRKGHPAKKVFQAIRIEVNNELDEFEKTLKDALEVLNTEGRIAVITFHSLEDRICKKTFKEVTETNPVVKGMPNIPKEMLPDYKLITNKPILPTDIEIRQNSRSKSAKLRVIEKIK
ncbi:MAG: 16S rRNA (cytosine(1402)-N(4))-methyltransferase RsmH [Bacilli bacterium]|nr:16S rRNA (cytosine(1402)-N(4))-methyltransferase RsmH [Bacilli bacterium]